MTLRNRAASLFWKKQEEVGTGHGSMGEMAQLPIMKEPPPKNME